MKLNVSKGTAELETSSSSLTPTPVKKAKTKSNRYTQQEGEGETEANKLFKQIEAGILTPMKPFTKKNSTATTFNHSAVDVDFSASTFNSTTAKTKSTGEKGKKKSPPVPTGPKEKKPFITGYGLWSKEMRPKIQAQHPELDFPTISKKLGEMWNTQISKNEKHQWKLKADKMKAENEQRRATVISTGPQAVKAVGKLASTPNIHLPRVERMTPVDVACHLKILGESLSSLGKRMTEQKDQVTDRRSLNPLFDGLLCSLSSLATLTALDPRLDGCPRETHLDTLDNIAFIMPGI
jgi:high mobility group protein 2-like 1